MLESIHKQARFFVALGYPRDEVIAQLESSFPSQDADAAYEEAKRQFDKSEAELNAEIDRDERAVASEHDLTQTIHDDES